MRSQVLKTASAAVILLGLAAGSTHARTTAYPGRNGAIAFVRGGDLWTIRLDGSGLRRLTRTSAGEANPAWSPDGRQIAYDSGGEIFVVDADGGHPVNLSAVEGAPGSRCDEQPTWSPDGKQIAFSAITDDCTGAAGALYALNADGTGRRTIEDEFSGLLGGDKEPAWSPGGRRIAFTRSVSERMASGPYDFDIGLLDARSGKVIRGLTSNGASTSPAWRPDGTQLAFAGPGGITIMTAVGKSPHVLARGGAPAWSPDAGQIAYVGTGGLSVIRTNGSRARRLLLKCSCSAPDWQPLPK